MSGKNSSESKSPVPAVPDDGEIDAEQQQVRDGRRYQVSNQRGKASARVRYVEGTMPKGGCRFLS